MTEQGIVAGEVREVQEDRLTQNRVTHQLSAFFDEEPLERYHLLAEAYERLEIDGMPATFGETDLGQSMLRIHGGDALARAVRQGNVSLMSYFTGVTQRETELSEARALMRLIGEMRRDGFLGLFVGDTDNGKTNTALWLALLVLLDQLGNGVDVALATNVTTLEWQESELEERTEYVSCRSELEQVCEDREKVVAVIDELETEANATVNNYEVNAEFGNVLTFKSKYGLVLFPIFHRTDGLGAAPLFREHANYFLKQTRDVDDLDDDDYQVTFYRDHDSDDGFGSEVYSIPVPPLEPDGTYSPDEQAEFDIST